MPRPHPVDDRAVDARLRALGRRKNAKLGRMHPDVVWRILPVCKHESPGSPSGHDALRTGHLQNDGLKSRYVHLRVKLHALLDVGLLPQHLAVRGDYAERRRFVNLVAAIDAADRLQRNGAAAKRNRDAARRLDAKHAPMLFPGNAHVSKPRFV